MQHQPERLCLRALGVLALVLAGCGAGMSGTYASEDGSGCLEFREGGRVYVTFGSSTFVGEYELDGDRVIIAGPGGSQVCTLTANQLEGFGMAFLKESPTCP